MKKLYKVSEFQGGSGQWYAGCVEKLAENSGAWWLPARILDLSPVDYVQWLIDNYKPDHISFDTILHFSWNKEHYSLMHRYVLYMNNVARRKKFYV